MACTGVYAQGEYQLTHFTADYAEITDAEVQAETDWAAPKSAQ